MRMNRIISKQFGELEEKMKNVAASKTGPEIDSGVDNALFQEWATSVLSLLSRIFSESSIHFNNFKKVYDDFHGYYYEFNPLMGIFRSAMNDYNSGYLYRVESLVSAEIIDDVLEQAQYLLDNNYKDPACVIAGVALETAIKKLCDINSIKHGKLDKMNADLAKAGVYNIGMQKQITAWADRRNNAAHGNWNSYNESDVNDMIKGIQRFMGEYL